MGYTAADGTGLPMLVFDPPAGVRPAAGVVLFHGGALRKGSPDDLAGHCRRLASHGVFAVSAGYRLLGRGAAGIDDCVDDVRRAVERFRALAASRGVTRPASGGSSAGAHLALVAAMTGPTDGGAVVAFNPAGLDLLAFPADVRRGIERNAGIGAGRASEYSVVELVRPGGPSTLIHHGTADEVEPIDHVRRFRDAMTRAGNPCTLIEYGNARHAFHYGDEHLADVVDATARFLLDLAVR
ncbi:alpha/beta hydrolase [Virgisporangium ochraceum]|nr:alpha/beta hydrolase [Virgisporangium ochraceum]